MYKPNLVVFPFSILSRYSCTSILNNLLFLCQKSAKSVIFLHISLISDIKLQVSTQQFAAFFALIHPRNAFFPFVDDYDALFCPKYANCRRILNKSADAAYRCFSALQMLIFLPPKFANSGERGFIRPSCTHEKPTITKPDNTWLGIERHKLPKATTKLPMPAPP